MTRGKAPARPAIAAILAEATRVGWPTRFATDLDYDIRAINAMDPLEPFGWILREDGTHIAPAPTAYRAHSMTRLTIPMIVDAFGAAQCRIYVWNGRNLCEYSSATLAQGVLATIARGDYDEVLIFG